MLQYGAFYANVRHKGPYYTQHYWTRVRSYMIRIAVDSNDPDFLRKSKLAVMKVEFDCGLGSGKALVKQTGAVATKVEPYRGPTVPTWNADAAIKAKPALGVPAGDASGGVYRNPTLGLQYELPSGWDVLPTKSNREPPTDARELREYNLLHACSRILLHAAPHEPDDISQHVPTALITLRVLDPTCLSMKIPSSVVEKKVADEMIPDLELLAEFGEIKSSDLISQSDHLFMTFRGTIGWLPPEEVLSRRMSEVLVATLHHNLLLIWSMMTSSSAELDAMPTTRVIFDDSRSVVLPLPAVGITFKTAN
jgi:hypothetical protein